MSGGKENSPQKLTDEEKGIIRKLAISYDKEKKGSLDLDEFLGFMKAAVGMEKIEDFNGEVPESGRVPVLQMQYLYDGIDLERTNLMKIDDACTCFINYKEKNFEWLQKMIFRGCDTGMQNNVSIDDIMNAIQNLGENPLSPEEFQVKCIREYGHLKKHINFAEFTFILNGSEINMDPYDQSLIRKPSHCCILV